jgi:threonine synthase
VARYDLPSAYRGRPEELFGPEASGIWRYHRFLPVLDARNVVSLGEGSTPVLRLERLGALLGFAHLWLKDESPNPTGSFKARGMSVAVSKAKELGVRELCVPTAGNAGGALAAYAASAGLRSHIYMPDDTPEINILECRAYGAEVHLIHGLISDAAKQMNAEKKDEWFDVSTLKEPYRLEGKKTLGYEIAEQFGWKLPDVIVYPTGGGTGLIGMWKAFAELEEMGWIDSSRPRMVAVQSSGCAPVVRAFQNHEASTEFWEHAETIASGLRVPKAFADNLILDALYESGGLALAVAEEAILEAARTSAREEGILVCPEGAATIAAVPRLKETGFAGENDSVLLFNTGLGTKYVEVLRTLE